MTQQSAQQESNTHCKFTWKCFVLPGVADTGTFFIFSMLLIVELLPTLG